MNKLNIDNTFTCMHCNKTFIKEWSDEEAMDEANKLFQPCSKHRNNLLTVCDDCYKEIINQIN